MLFLLQFYLSQKVKMHNRLFREKRKGREAIPQAQVRQKARCNGGHQKTFRSKPARSPNVPESSRCGTNERTGKVSQFTHIYRRTAATRMAENGATILDIQIAGGWKSEKIARRYVESSNKTKVIMNSVSSAFIIINRIYLNEDEDFNQDWAI